MERHDRQMGNSGQKETEIVSSNPPVKYRRGKSESGTSPEARAIIEEIFAREPNRSVVSVSWVQRARSRGAEYEAGVTWLSAIIDPQFVAPSALLICTVLCCL